MRMKTRGLLLPQGATAMMTASMVCREGCGGGGGGRKIGERDNVDNIVFFSQWLHTHTHLCMLQVEGAWMRTMAVSRTSHMPCRP